VRRARENTRRRRASPRQARLGCRYAPRPGSQARGSGRMMSPTATRRSKLDLAARSLQPTQVRITGIPEARCSDRVAIPTMSLPCQHIPRGQVRTTVREAEVAGRNRRGLMSLASLASFADAKRDCWCLAGLAVLVSSPVLLMNQRIRIPFAGIRTAGTGSSELRTAGTGSAGARRTEAWRTGTPRAGTSRAGTSRAGTSRAGTPRAGTRTAQGRRRI
jgi:hypothetical protein